MITIVDVYVIHKFSTTDYSILTPKKWKLHYSFLSATKHEKASSWGLAKAKVSKGKGQGPLSSSDLSCYRIYKVIYTTLLQVNTEKEKKKNAMKYLMGVAVVLDISKIAV